uniref:SFR19-like C-terminal domain-containing protein n=1 Tax=Cyanistes caeruleus TaxID=156563 RepID=A0A8C0TZ08_CYACU
MAILRKAVQKAGLKLGKKRGKTGKNGEKMGKNSEKMGKIGQKMSKIRSGEINPVKVNNLVCAYVQRYKYFRKRGRKGG